MSINPADIQRLHHEIEEGKRVHADKERHRDTLKSDNNRLQQELTKKEAELKKIEIEIKAAEQSSTHDAHQLLELERQIKETHPK